MKQIKLGNTLLASAIGLGCMRMADMSIVDAEKVIRTAVENGITLAPLEIYFHNE